jgi:hypothetical protein
MEDECEQLSRMEDLRSRRWYGLHRFPGGWWLWLPLIILGVGCGQVTMQPILSSSVSIEAFEELGEIRRAPVHVAILIQPELRNLTFQLEQGPAIYHVPVGKVIAAKLVKLASYQFNEVSLVRERSTTSGLLLDVGLQQEQPGLTADVDRRGLTVMVDVRARIDLRLRATLTDRDATIWVGAPRVTEEIQTGALEQSGGAAVDLSRAISETVDRATDRLVADLMRQVRRSDNLRQYLEERRS